MSDGRGISTQTSTSASVTLTASTISTVNNDEEDASFNKSYTALLQQTNSFMNLFASSDNLSQPAIPRSRNSSVSGAPESFLAANNMRSNVIEEASVDGDGTENKKLSLFGSLFGCSLDFRGTSSKRDINTTQEDVDATQNIYTTLDTDTTLDTYTTLDTTQDTDTNIPNIGITRHNSINSVIVTLDTGTKQGGDNIEM